MTVPVLPDGEPLTILADLGGADLTAANLVLDGQHIILAESDVLDALDIESNISDADAVISVAGPGVTELSGAVSVAGITLESGVLKIDRTPTETIAFAPTASVLTPLVLDFAASATTEVQVRGFSLGHCQRATASRSPVSPRRRSRRP